MRRHIALLNRRGWSANNWRSTGCTWCSSLESLPMLFCVVDPSCDTVLCLDVAVISLWGKVVLSHGGLLVERQVWGGLG